MLLALEMLNVHVLSVIFSNMANLVNGQRIYS